MPSTAAMPWRLSIDTGGTFTDCLATSPEGRVRRVKVLSSSAVRARATHRPDARTIVTDWAIPAGALAGCTLAPLHAAAHKHGNHAAIIDHDSGTISLNTDVDPAALPPGAAFEVRSPWQPPILAARIATATPARDPLPPIHMRLATTRGTNALLERRGHPPALFITRGFRDLLAIGDQTRPDLFALDIIKPPPLHAVSIEVTERLAADGSVLIPLDLDALRPEALEALRAGHTTAAVALLHAWINSAHEHAVAAMLRDLGFSHVCTSADLSPLIGFLPRTQSAVVNGYLSRVVGDYLAGVRDGLGPAGDLFVMTSGGGLARADRFHPKDSLLSGPAGGLLGAAVAADDAGRSAGPARGTAAATSAGAFDRVLTFDMGGTSTDVARCISAHRREFPLAREQRVGDARILAPAALIESVAAGGGSICSFERSQLRVGPESAGASPGPACYGAGGPLTITDCHLLLGRLAVDRFAVPLSLDAARAAALDVLAAVNRVPGNPQLSLEALLEGFLALADERMADAIRRISIRHGEDPAAYSLLAFGGAGGLHACALAERLGIRSIIIPPDAGLLSARGLSAAAIQRPAQRQILRQLTSDPAGAAPLAADIAELEHQARAAVAEEGVPPDAITIARREASCRILGQSASFDIPADDLGLIPARFAAAYTRAFGHQPPARPIEVESVLVIAQAAPADGPLSAPAEAPTGPEDAQAPHRSQRLFVAGAWQTAPVVARQSIAGSIPGPAIIADAHATTYVAPGWSAGLSPSGAIMLQRAAAAAASAPDAGDSPIALELFIASLSAIAQDMGEMLRRTALSVNVKERLDFSCAILDPDGALLVNAPHVPVHLGAMGLCVRAVRDALELGPGDTAITNHPGFGGSHLPDITLITPIYTGAPGRERLVAYAASRAHHAELGGITPGSMPAGATRLAEEAVVIPPMHLVRAGVERFEALADHLTSAPFPTRALEHNLADIRAALAANQHAVHAIAALFERTGLDRSLSFCAALTDRAERRITEALGRLAPGVYRHADRLDDGSPIAAAITIPEASRPGARVRIDFTGAAPVHAGNLNATRAITTAATLYVLRLLAREDLPLNEGLLRAIDLVVPTGSILDPGRAWSPGDGPAVAAGNVETSQRIVDTLLLALGLAAASQGTMNNLTFGNERFGFYETICGGAGATTGAAGASAVHTHMTNTRITDVEILETRLPVRITEFGIRFGSGGRGYHRGGDGVVRAFQFLKPVTCSILAQRRSTPPPGLAGGGPGMCGRHRWIHGARATPAPTDRAGEARIADAGDRLIIETPGGGGWGVPASPA